MFSCNQNVLQLGESNFNIVFSYENEDLTPVVSLSVFTEIFTDPRLIESMEITSLEKGFIWTIDKVEKFKNDNKNYAGTSNLMIPNGENFPTGLYKIKFITYDGSEVIVNSNFDYKKDFFNKKINDYINYYGEDILKYIAIYDENNVLIYYGFKSDDYLNPVNIKNMYKNADNYNDVWVYNGSSELIIFPEQKLNLES